MCWRRGRFVGGVDDDGDAGYVTGGELSCHCINGVADPGANFGMAVLMDGEIVCLCGEEGGGGVDVAVVEDIVDGNSQKRVERRQQNVGVVQRKGVPLGA